VTGLTLRIRLALVFTAGFAVLLGLAALGLYLVLAHGYRTHFDDGLQDAGHAAASLFEHDRLGHGSALATVVHVVGELTYGDRTLVAFDSTSRVVAASQRFDDQPWFGDAPPDLPPMRPETIGLNEGRARVLLTPLTENIKIAIAMSTAPLDRQVRTFRHTMLVGLPLILLIGAGVGIWGSAAVLRPIGGVAAAAERIGAEVARGATAFEHLPPHSAPDEIGRLTAAFNQLVNRLGAALAEERATGDRQRRFLADAAHELRTPVAILRSDAEVTLRGAAELGGYRSALERVAAESDRLGGLLNDLLLIARGDERAIRPDRKKLYLDDVMNGVLARARKLPEAEGRVIRRGEFEAAPTMGDAAMLERVLMVLVRNALLHAPGAAIELSTGVAARPEGDVAWARVHDSGPGIAPAHRERIFDRFTRFSTAVPGSGLGLAIARSMAAAHGGSLVLDEVAVGASFTLRLPVATP
jgi:signal transduction histidine kinase